MLSGYAKENIDLDQFVFFLALSFPAPANAPEDWFHRGEENLMAWHNFLEARAQAGYFEVPLADEKVQP